MFSNVLVNVILATSIGRNNNLANFHTITKSFSIPINDSFAIKGHMANINYCCTFVIKVQLNIK